MTRQTITVAIPSYNKESQISRCIESILKNAEDIDEIILIDNCSEDKTFEIAQSYQPKLKCVKNETNVGMSTNFNRCIELCNTGWLMIFHADDMMLEEAIKKYRKLIEKYPDLGLIHADSYSLKEGGVHIQTYSPRVSKEYYPAGLAALSCPYGICSAVMVKKEAYDRLGLFLANSFSPDVEMWARVASQYPVGSICEPTVTYYSSVNSTGPQSLVKRKFQDIKKDWDNLTKIISQYYPSGPAREAYLAKIRNDSPGNNFAIIKANLRAKNWRNVLTGLHTIIIKDLDLWPLIKIVSSIIFTRCIGLIKKAISLVHAPLRKHH